jgi:hypothetical protein
MTILAENSTNHPLSLLGRLTASAQVHWPTAVRAGVVVAALAIIYWRIPSDLTNPQFWAEDGLIFLLSYQLGWQVLTTPLAGYLLAVPCLTVFAASFFPELAPTICNYTAVLLTLLVAWLATSPRFDMPHKPLLVLAVVSVPAGFEVLGNITNVQWILPIGAFILLFLRPGGSVPVAIHQPWSPGVVTEERVVSGKRLAFSTSGPINAADQP